MGKLGEEKISTSTVTLFERISIEHIFETCKRRNFSCAMYQLPVSLHRPEENNKQNKHLIVDLSPGIKLENLHLDEMGSGFIFHPFSVDKHPIKFIQKDLHIVEDNESSKLELVHSTISTDKFIELFNECDNPESKHTESSYSKAVFAKSTHEEKSIFIELVNSTIEEINKDSFQKAVITRNKLIQLPENFNSVDFFNTLSNQYLNAFTYLTYIPEIGSWLGATPETLINIDRNQQFKTISLAATQAFNEIIDLEDTTWSQKDIEEQAMVSRYIINCFKKIRLREFEEIGPRTHLSGNLVHLKTEYTVEMNQEAFPELGTVMLELLHPTSAVCGMPKESSREFILKNEGFDREYFSGFLGPINVLDETNIFVNLRCMKLLEKQARLYAGAGIIANSNPEKEWNETEIKMETLLKVLKEVY